MPLGGALIGGGALVGGVGGALIGSSAASGAVQAATKARQDALKQWLAVNVPDPAQQAIELQRYQSVGSLSPQLQTAFEQSQTGLKGMQIDPASRAAEIKALTSMQDVASKGGLDAQALQQEQQALNSSNANEQGQRGAIEQNFAARGMGGAGAELAAELQASQGDANQAAAGGLNASAMAQQRALQSMTGAAQIGGTINNQDYNQAANAATAQDAINRFNTQTQQNVSNANVGTQNQAQATNLQNAQTIANQNVGVANTEETHNKGLIQQQFQNEVSKAGGAANAENGVANQANLSAQNTANQWAGIGSAVSQGAGAYAQYANSQKNSGNEEGDEEEE